MNFERKKEGEMGRLLGLGKGGGGDYASLWPTDGPSLPRVGNMHVNDARVSSPRTGGEVQRTLSYAHQNKARRPGAVFR